MEKVEKNLGNTASKNIGSFVKGWSWGEIKISQDQIYFEVSDQSWFTIPYSGISNALVPTKNELGLEFNIEEEDSKNDILCGMRFYIPNKISEENHENGEDKSNKSVSSGNDKEHSAAMLKEQIMKYSNVGTYGDAIVHLSEMPMITPRGKFDLYFLKNMMKIHGPSHDYKLTYKNIFKALLLPKPDGAHFAFVLGLTNPLRQGNTSYPFLVFQLKTPNEKTVTVNLPDDEEERKQILKSEIDSEVKGELIDIVAKLFKAIVGVSVIIPGHFRSFRGASCLKCSLKASEGYIYLLERGIIFIHKPVVYIGFEEIRQVEFSRISDSTMQQRTFDITIRRRNEDIQFMGIEKNELEPLSNYLVAKKVVIKSNDGGSIQEIKPSTVSSSSRRTRTAPEEVPMELPSEDEIEDGDYSSQDDKMDVDEEDDEDEEEEEQKPKKKKKN